MRHASTVAALSLLIGTAGAATARPAPDASLGQRVGVDVMPVEAAQTGPGCPTLPVRSPFTGKRASAYFQNRSGQQPLKLYWIDGVGGWQFKEEIAPGKSTSVGTIVGARFVLVDPTGRCVQTPIVNLPNSTFLH